MRYFRSYDPHKVYAQKETSSENFLRVNISGKNYCIWSGILKRFYII